MNKCHDTYGNILCPYALSDNAPVPCVANYEQCLEWRDKSTIDKLENLKKERINNVINAIQELEVEK